MAINSLCICDGGSGYERIGSGYLSKFVHSLTNNSEVLDLIIAGGVNVLPSVLRARYLT